MRFLSSLLLVLSLAAAAAAQPNCSNTSVGLTPIGDLGAGTYMGFTGGHYPGGSNTHPPAHLAAGVAIANAIVPRGPSGDPSPAGRIVLLSIGMSNTTQEFSRWFPFADVDPTKNHSLVIVDGAQGGWDAYDILDPNAAYWSNIEARLAQRFVTRQQVAAVWFKEAESHPTLPFPQHALALRNAYAQAMGLLRTKYPNLRIAFVSNRSYAGYSSGPLNPEPYAYETGFAVKWLVEAQIQGHPSLNFDPSSGPVVAPWIDWGPDLWADGVNPRSDGLHYLCSDYREDGTHPGAGAAQKISAMLRAHFSNHPAAAAWYLGPGGLPPGGVRAQNVQYGNSVACQAAGGTPAISADNRPVLGNPAYTLRLQNVLPGVYATLFVSLAPDIFALPGTYCVGELNITPGVRLLPAHGDPATLLTNANGEAALSYPIPPIPALEGLPLFAQWLALDTTHPAGYVTSNGLELVIGQN